ncbi:hypothetical protein CLAIMM_03531 [Cladophialophora immunda]|nr:hypothetical protein CLAIMM_03531 [Cladophialophora immunda]
MTDIDLKTEGVVHATFDQVETLDGNKTISASYIDETNGASSHNKSKQERRLVLKCDLLLLTLAILIYLVTAWDRNNIGNARLMGLQEQLHMSNRDFYNAVMMYYVSYIIFMLPANVFVRSIQAHRQVGICVMAFGTFVCCMSAVKSTSAILGLRFLVGMASVFVQGLSIYLSIYYSAATIAGAFSGLIAYGIQKNMDGALGRPAWQWIFIIQGSAAILVGILVYILLPLGPDQMRKAGKAHWLFTEQEIDLAIFRMKTYNTVDAKFEPKQIWAALVDVKTWFFCLMNSGIAIALISLSSFLPTFINQFGYSPIRTQLFSVIPYACAFVTLLVLNSASDRVNLKGPFLMLCLSISIVGYIILLCPGNVHVKIFGSCLIVAGTFPAVTFLGAWIGINTAGFTKRAATWAICEVWGQSFAILGTRIYTDPPRFVKGHSIVLSFQVLALLAVVACYFWLRRLNRQKAEDGLERTRSGQAHPDLQKSLEEVHDRHPLFVYTL